MNAEILAIGTEILIGDILNTNSHYLSQQLAKLGVSCYHHSVVGDNYSRLKSSLELALSRADIVITTGGLGPTLDDITVQVAATVFKKNVVTHIKSYNQIENFLKKRGLELTESVMSQSQVVEGAIVLLNKNGLAPGSLIKENGKLLAILPGPPEEMKSMWLDLLPYIKSLSNEAIVSKTIHMAGIGESLAETTLKDLIENQKNPTIAPYAKSNGGVDFRITANAKTEKEAYELMSPIVKEVYLRLGNYIYGENQITLEEALINLLIEKKLTLSVAESITGGTVISRLINVPGASKVILEGIVAYSNSSKVSRGLVQSDQLKKYGAVSKETAASMAKNIATFSGASIGISTTGIAQTSENEGIAYFGICINGITEVISFHGLGNRNKIRNQVAYNIIESLRKLVIVKT